MSQAKNNKMTHSFFLIQMRRRFRPSESSRHFHVCGINILRRLLSKYSANGLNDLFNVASSECGAVTSR